VPLSVDNIVQSNTGTSGAGGTAASFTVSLPFGVTAGNQVIVVTQITTTSWASGPTGWVREIPFATVHRMILFRRSDRTAGASIAGESSWTFTPTAASRYSWVCYEVAGLADDPLEQSATSTSNSEPQTTGTTAINSAYDTMVVAVHAAVNGAGTTTPSWSSQTNGFVEQNEVGTSTGAVGNIAFAVSLLFPGNVGTFESSATSDNATNNTTGGGIVVYKSATSMEQAAIAYHTGFEFGHDGGLTVGPLAARLASASSGATVVAGSAKTGSYGLRLTASASQAYYYVSGFSGNILPTSKDSGAMSFWLRVPSVTGTVVLAYMTDGAAITTSSSVNLVYDPSTSQLGVRWAKQDGSAAGTITYQSGTTATNTWVLVDMAYWGAKGTTRNMAWSLDGVAQTALAAQTGTAGILTLAGLGSFGVTGTFTADYDDFRVSINKNDHPIGAQKVVPLKVDAAGTVTLSGTSTNFQTFAGATPTMSAWNATTARNAVDEVPPGLGASADGFAQVAAAASDYVQVPMETYTLAAGEMIVAVRALVAGWAAGASAIGLRGWDGITETVLWATADPSFNNSSTAPGWLAVPWYQSGGRWTQAKLDAACLRLGFGTSATDIGAHALYLEVVIGTSASRQLFGGLATAGVDPGGNNAIVGVTVTAPDYGTGDTSLYYEVAGTPTTVPVTAGTTATQTIDEASAGVVNYIALYPPPEHDPVE
jgi:hypothetical protein